MTSMKGIGVSPGIAFGRLKIVEGSFAQPERKTCEDPGKELSRLKDAIRAVEQKLDDEYRKSIESSVDEETAEIFEIHKMMLTDPDFLDPICEKITTEHVNGEYAVSICSTELAEEFRQLDDEYMSARAADIRDISERLVSALSGNMETCALTEPAIVAGRDFTPGQTMAWNKEMLLGIILEKGSATAHVSILSKSRGIPCIISLNENYGLLENGQSVIIDGNAGTVIVDADEKTEEAYRMRWQREKAKQDRDRSSAGKPAMTRDGKKVDIFSNISSIADVAGAIENGAEGIGLFRSEFLYMEQDTAPSEEVQFEAYRQVVSAMQGKPVVIRTLDVGADKQIPYLDLGKEENPALGQRAIRIYRKQACVFKTQIRALLRASEFGDLRIMLPMVVNLEELQQAREVIGECTRELVGEGKKIPEVKVGIMIETPAAALISDQLAAHADFFSIGTNDLTQYTLAVDRVNPSVAGLYDPRHPAVLKLIEMTVSNAKAHGIETGICGESAGDPKLLPFYLSLGITELSLNSSRIPETKALIRQSTVNG
jgi:phosphotransferase system enzyme I (PtsI)